MSIKRLALSAFSVVLLAGAAFAEGTIMIKDPYARVSRPGAPSGAAFMVIENHGETDDRLIAANTDISARVELHTHIEKSDGVMQMVEIEDGIPVPAGGKHMMVRGGDHVMFMGLNQKLDHGDSVEVKLVFEKAGEITVTIPVDLERKPKHGHGGHDHSGHGSDG